MVLIIMPVENIRIKSKARDSSQMCNYIGSLLKESKLNWDGAQRMSETSLSCPRHTMASRACSDRKHLGKLMHLPLSSSSARLGFRDPPWPASVLPETHSSQLPQACKWLVLGLVSRDVSYSKLCAHKVV